MWRRLGSRRRSAVAAAAAIALSASGMVAASAVVQPPHLNHTVGLAKVGPIDETNGYPITYTDTNGTRLELCADVTDTLCLHGALPDPTKPQSFPDNWPDESFYSAGNARIDAGGGQRADLTTAIEATTGGTGVVFGRLRIRAEGLVDNGAYKVTHPYGVDNFVSTPGASRGINSTEDIGNLSGDGNFEQVIASRPAPFLKWDATGAAAPAGYVGDPNVDHTVTGSPYNTNLFRIEGPAGSFTGSSQLCADPKLGQSSTATDDCIETKLFSVQGKLATRAGVQVTKAVYQKADGGQLMDLFAKSEPGQQLTVTGTGIAQTLMKGDAKGNYFARVYAAGAPPTDLAVTNATDKPASVDHVDQKLFGDNVRIVNATFDTDASTLEVTAQSGDPAAKLSLDGFPGAPSTTDSQGHVTWKVPNVNVPPADAVVTSDKGGVGSNAVIVSGGQFATAQVKAVISASSNSVQTGAPVTLDSTLSSGTITSVNWAVTSGPAGATLSSTNTPGTTFTATAAGTYNVRLTVTGAGVNNTSTADYSIAVAGVTETPVADAGPDQTGVAPTSTVTLDGSNSKFAKTYSWTAPAGITLNNPTTANPTFVMPTTTTPTSYTFTLTITDADGTKASDTVTVTSAPDSLDISSATYKLGTTTWRIKGGAGNCSVNNVLTFSWVKADGSQAVIGTATPTDVLGVCSYDFIAKNVATTLRPTAPGKVNVKSALGGSVTGDFQVL